jgi:hypothetical protein
MKISKPALAAATASAVIALPALAWGTTTLISHLEPKPDTFRMTGVVLLRDPLGVEASGEYCTGVGDYADVAEGAQVVVTSPAGATIGAARLGRGVASGRACEFSVAITGLPSGERFYNLRVAGQVRQWQLSEADARRGVSARLGTPPEIVG